MKKSAKERRRYERYDTEVRVYFRVGYDIKTIVMFQLIDQSRRKIASPKYSAVSKNVSVEGLAFTARKELKPGDRLYLEVYLPKTKNPIIMEGEVRWCQSILSSPGKTARAGNLPVPALLAGRRQTSSTLVQYETGIKLLTIDGQVVAGTIYYDKGYNVFWSAVLETILGNFKKLAQGILSKSPQKMAEPMKV